MRKKQAKGNILFIVDSDSPELSTVSYFQRKKFNVLTASKYHQTVKILKYYAFLFVIFDNNMPLKDNTAIADCIYNFDNHTKIFFICDEYQYNAMKEILPSRYFILKKPLIMRNLYNKMRDMSFTEEYGNSDIQCIKIGNCTFNFTERFIRYNDRMSSKKISMTAKECSILQILCLNKDKFVPAHRIQYEVWGKDNYLTAKNLSVYMTKLRSLLSLDKSIEIINKHSFGYCIHSVE